MSKIYFSDDDMCTTRKLSISRVQDFYLQNGWQVTNDPQDADLIAVLTCSGWSELETRSLEKLKTYQKYGNKVVSVGCTNDANLQAVKAVHKGELVSAHNIEDLSRFIQNPTIPIEKIPFASTFRRKEDYRLYDLTKRFVNIAEGCSFDCTFCTHKPGLGPKRSRSIQNIIEHIQMLLTEELNILVLTGMETSMYGREFKKTYPDLLEAIFQLDGNFQIHVAQFTPSGVHLYTDELLKTFSNPRVTDVQIPIQTTSDRLLKMMKRPKYQDELYQFLKQLRRNNPKIITRTDLIVGFPSETTEELENSLKYATKVFDEIAVYGCEIVPNRPVEKFRDLEILPKEMNKRIIYAKKYIKEKGLLAHGGQQESNDLSELEKQKEQMRKNKGQK